MNFSAKMYPRVQLPGPRLEVVAAPSLDIERHKSLVRPAASLNSVVQKKECTPEGRKEGRMMNLSQAYRIRALRREDLQRDICRAHYHVVFSFYDTALFGGTRRLLSMFDCTHQNDI